MYRSLVYLRRFLAVQETSLRRVPEAGVLVAAAIIVVVGVIATGSGWAVNLRDQVITLLSSVLTAGVTYVLFTLSRQRRLLSTYLEQQRRHAPSVRQHDPEMSALARTIVDEVLDAKSPRGALIIGPTEVRQARLLYEVGERLAAKRRVPVAVDLPSVSSDVSLPVLAGDQFVAGLQVFSGLAQSPRLLYAERVQAGQVVALVRGLDRVGEGEPLRLRRAAIARLLQGSLDEGIPFVAWLHPDLAPSISGVAAFRTRPLPRSELVAYTMGQFRERGLFDLGIERILSQASYRNEPTDDTVLLSLFADLVLRRVRVGEEGRVAAAALFSDSCAFRRHLAWMCEWALDCTLGELDKASSAPLLALAAIGRETHYRQEAELRSADASAPLDADGRRRFAAGVAWLYHRGVLHVTHFEGSNRLRFTHPAWLAFAGTLGLRLDTAYWRDLLRPDTSSATLDALTGALLIFGPGVLRERSFLRVLLDLGLSNQADLSLEIALSVITALQSTDEPLDFGDAEMAALERAWSMAGDIVRTRFVSDVNLEMNPLLMDFLWRQVVPPAYIETSFRVRRAICSRLASLGSVSWRRLLGDWRELVSAASAENPSSWTRRTALWDNHGYAVASLGRTLPGVLRSVDADEEDDVFALLSELRKLVQRGSDGEGRAQPEIGLEIALAEGFKIAAAEMATGSESRDKRWAAEAESFLESSTAWVSRQTLVQALALLFTDATGERLARGVGQIIGRLEADEYEHPFVREAAALVRRGHSEGKRLASLTERDIWLEDVEALDDGGVNLSPECHRLLALSTLLIKLAEWQFNDLEAAESSVVAIDRARDRAFTGIELPRCFLRRSHAATMFEATCDCPFNFCGPEAKRRVLYQGQRFSLSFLQRAQNTAHARRLIESSRGNGFVEGAFTPAWRALSSELASEESTASSRGTGPNRSFLWPR